MPEPDFSSDNRMPPSAPLARHPREPTRLSRVLLLALFFIATVALVFGVITMLNRQTESNLLKTAPRDTRQAPTPSAKPRRTPDTSKNPATSPVPTPPAEQTTLIEPPPPLPDGIEEKSPGMEALEVLEIFLAAGSLKDRLPMIETKTPMEELQSSCLAGPLPAIKSMVIYAQESNPIEQVVDFYYNVDFEDEERPANPQTILVRTRGSTAPKVVVDPFLDLYGGRLAQYAATPSEKGGIFQVIVYPVASCLDPDIPDRDKKRTLKLLARDNTKEIALASFSRVSKIGEMLEDGTYSLSYGKAKSCTVMLRWNTEDRSDHPYLEAIAIKTLDWNP